MAICAFCEREMDEADSCTKNVIIYQEPDLDDGGQWMFAIPYGEEERGIVDKSDLDSTDRCHDCGVTRGGFHHPGCDVEESPFTRGQLLMEVISATDDTRPYHARAQADPHEHVEVDIDTKVN